MPDKVNWTYRGEVFPLEIEFEDTDLFADAVNRNDVDMHDRDGNTGAKGSPSDEPTREGPNGSHPAQSPGDGTGVEPAASPAVPMTTLRFGSFEPASAPPRLWSDRVDSDDYLEHTLPPLEFEGDAGLCAGRSARTLVGATERRPEGASLVLAPHVDATPVSATAGEVGRGGGGSGQVASPTPHPIPTPVTHVLRGSANAGRGSPRQAASAPATPMVAVTTAAAAALGVLGQEALAPPSSPTVRRTASPSPMAHPSEPAGGVGGGCWGTLQKTKVFLRFHQDPSMSSSSNEYSDCIYIPL